MRSLRLAAAIPLLLCATSSPAPAAETSGFALAPTPFTEVKFTDRFWLPRLETNRTVTVPACFRKCEQTGRIDNFSKAAGRMEGEFRGIYFDDSDVYKAIEGAAYTLAIHKDPALDKYLDDLIDKIAAAQRPDGYLNTYYTLTGIDKRWTNIKDMHEMYCAGHLMEAAVAHFQATGKRSLLDVATKLADHIGSVFGHGKRRDPCGHEEVELALVKLYRVTNQKRYLDLAHFMIDQRGIASGHKLYGEYAQDHKPVEHQTEPVGHSVRAGYLYTGMADVAALAGERRYVKPLESIWQHLVSRKLYLTGGIGAEAGHEGFGPDYHLPNASAYNETCAAIANALWNQRMNLLFADAKYADLVELVAYNGFLSGVGQSGDVYFYPNPLAFNGSAKFNMGSCRRSPWFDCACCPVNIVRFLPSLPGYVYASGPSGAYVNLYVASSAAVNIGEQKVGIKQETDYPWDGRVRLTIEPEQAAEFTLHLRIPGWTRGEVVASDLYRSLGERSISPTIRVNGQSVRYELKNGYAPIARRWQAGDVIEINMAMPVRRIVAHDKVQDNAGRVALIRGPLVYCVEAVDHGGAVRNLVLADDAEISAVRRDDLLGGVTILTATGRSVERSADGKPAAAKEAKLTAIPYYAWNHRELGEMAVWLPRTPDVAQPLPAATMASTSRPSASHTWQNDSLEALADQSQPASSSDHGVPRFTWWDHRGTAEWVQYNLKKRSKVSAVEVYWFDDTGKGQCRVPASWRLVYKDGDAWESVKASGSYGVEKDRFNVVRFEPVETDAVRIEAQLAPNVSAGILEWRVE